MSLTLNKLTYAKLIDEDIDWLLNQPKTLEREHILDILKVSIDAFYPPKDYIPLGFRSDHA